MTHKEKAIALFKEGYNCSQSVFGAFAEDFGMDVPTAMRLSSSFGGGMGRMREVCGAVSGMFMVAGMTHGYDDPKDFNGKKQHYEYIQQLAAKFKEENSSIICRELLGLDQKGPDAPTPEKRTNEYYKKRPCVEMVACAARIMEEELNKQK